MLFKAQNMKKSIDKDANDVYDSVKVEKTGPNIHLAEQLNDFTDICDRIPEFIMNNIQRMNFERPTPIQRHSILPAILGMDLMCCAQTVRRIFILYSLHGRNFSIFKGLGENTCLPFTINCPTLQGIGDRLENKLCISRKIL
jgi:hypothetical protein